MDYAGCVNEAGNVEVDEFSESISKLNISTDEGVEIDMGETSLLSNGTSPNGHKSVTPDESNQSTPRKKEDLEEAPGVTFYPAVYIQRYNAVREALEAILNLEPESDNFPVKVIEFGCAELKLHQHLKGINGRIQKLIYVDKDTCALDMNKRHIRPLAYEYLKKRETPLRVEVFAGCATKIDPRLLEDPALFAVVGIELIEHLDPDILTGFEKAVFGVLKPPIVLLTTPNADFNVVFNMAPNTFRHWDHRFEWTREEFNSWCFGICCKYPGYTFEVTGIGAGSPDTYQYGCVSQMATFRKTPNAPPVDYAAFSDVIIPECYTLYASEDYPFFVDTTPRDEQIVRAFKWHISNYILNYSNVEVYRYEEKTEVALAVDAARYISGMPKNVDDLEEVREALVKHGYTLRTKSGAGNNDWEIVLKVPIWEDERNSWSEEGEEEMESEHNYDGHGDQLPDSTPPSNSDAVLLEADDEEW